jgi:hypothetical protein
LEDDFSVSAVTKEVRNVSKTLGLWNRVAPGSAGAVVVFISLGRHAWTAPAARCPLPTIVVCRGHGLEELFGSLLDCVILRCRTFFFKNKLCFLCCIFQSFGFVLCLFDRRKKEGC